MRERKAPPLSTPFPESTACVRESGRRVAWRHSALANSVSVAKRRQSVADRFEAPVQFFSEHAVKYGKALYLSR